MSEKLINLSWDTKKFYEIVLDMRPKDVLIGLGNVPQGINFKDTEGMERENPFSAKKSGYGHKVSGDFISSFPENSEAKDFHVSAHNYFDTFVRDEKFPCIIGQTAIRTNQYAFSAYDDMTDPEVAEGVLHDIVKFQQEFEVPAKAKGPKGIFRTFIAAFRKPPISSDLQGAEVLYTLLQNMHEKTHNTMIGQKDFLMILNLRISDLLQVSQHTLSHISISMQTFQHAFQILLLWFLTLTMLSMLLKQQEWIITQEQRRS